MGSISSVNAFRTTPEDLKQGSVTCRTMRGCATHIPVCFSMLASSTPLSGVPWRIPPWRCCIQYSGSVDPRYPGMSTISDGLHLPYPGVPVTPLKMYHALTTGFTVNRFPSGFCRRTLVHGRRPSPAPGVCIPFFSCHTLDYRPRTGSVVSRDLLAHVSPPVYASSHFRHHRGSDHDQHPISSPISRSFKYCRTAEYFTVSTTGDVLVT